MIVIVIVIVIVMVIEIKIEIVIVMVIVIVFVISTSLAGRPRPVFFLQENCLKTKTEPHYALDSESHVTECKQASMKLFI